MEVQKSRLRFRLIFITDGFILLLVQILQVLTLNYYFLKPYEEYFTTYFLFVLDFFCLCLFAGTLIVSYNHFTRNDDESVTRNKFISRIGSHFSKSVYGTLPLSYVSWIVYVAILLAKLAVIFGTDIVYKMLHEHQSYSAEIFKISVALSCIVFMLLVEGHNWHKKRSECYSYVTGICKKTGIEIFDSVEMLELLITTNKMSKPVENVVFVLIAVNFILPSISLYRLNISNFGKTITPNCFLLKIIHNVLKLAIDIPFLIVRLYILIYYHDASVLMIKNLFYIILALREFCLDAFFKPAKSGDKKTEEVPLSNEQTQTDGKA